MWADTNNRDVLITLITSVTAIIVGLVTLIGMVRKRGHEHSDLHEVVARIDERTDRMDRVLTEHVTDYGSHVSQPKLSIVEEHRA